MWSFSSVYWRLFFFSPPLCQNDSSRSFVAGLNSQAASLQPANFSVGKLGSSCWHSKSLEQLEAVPLPSAGQGCLHPAMRGRVAAAANARGAGGCSVRVPKDGVET